MKGLGRSLGGERCLLAKLSNPGFSSLATHVNLDAHSFVVARNPNSYTHTPIKTKEKE